MFELRFPAAAGAILINGAMLAGLVAVAAQTRPALPEPAPIEVVMLAPEPLPASPEPAKPPEPLPVAAKPPPPPPPKEIKPKVVAKPRPVPTPVPKPAPVALAPPAPQPAPASITTEPAAPSTPPAEKVAVAAPPPAPPPEPVHEAPRADASWSGNSPPAYPALARRMGEQGEVRLDIEVNTDGSVAEIKLKKSSGSSLLDQTAMDTVKHWRFKPATVGGKAVAEWYYNWRWVFKLEG